MRQWYMQYLSETRLLDVRRAAPAPRARGGAGRRPHRCPSSPARTIDRGARVRRPGSSSARAERKIAAEVLKEIDARLGFLANVGLGYLTLDRPGPSLSGGESQRIRLASQIGSELTGVIYVLDEPSIGLHQRDNERLLATLERLRDIGNTVVVVEHDHETIEAADYVVDFGPGRGRARRRASCTRARRAGMKRSSAVADRRVPLGPARDRRRRARRRTGNGQKIAVEGATREQPEGRRRRVPARDARRGDRRLGRGQEHARERRPLPGAARALYHEPRRRSGEHTRARAASSSSTR